MKSRLTLLGLLLTFWTTLLLISCSKDSGSDYGSGGNNNPNPAPTGTTINISNMQFSVSTLNIKEGTTVTWVNNDDMLHRVTSDNGSFSSGDLKKGDTYKYTFNTLGTYAYHCGLHPTMKGTIIVDY